VDLAGDELLPRPALAVDQDGRLGVRHLVEHLEDLHHLFGLADDLALAVALAELPLEDLVLRLQAPHAQGIAHDQQDLVVLRLLLDVLERPLGHRLNRRGLGGVRRQDQHRERRIVRERLLEQLDAVHPGHLQVGDHEVDGFLLQARKRLGAAVGAGHGVPLFLQEHAQEAAHALLVVDHQDPDALALAHGDSSVRPRAATAPRPGWSPRPPGRRAAAGCSPGCLPPSRGSAQGARPAGRPGRARWPGPAPCLGAWW